MKPFSTPVAVITYNRLDTTKRLFEVLRMLQPQKLYLISDGHKNYEDKKKFNSIRSFIDQNVTWETSITRIYADKNMGLRKRIESGLNQVFKTEQRAIILEDDCIPDPSLFSFCDEMLEKYKHDDRVLSISGTNLFPNYQLENSYTFSRYFRSWGWATWKRAWDKYQTEVTDYEEVLAKNNFRKSVQLFLRSTYELISQNKINSWAYRWSLTHFRNQAFTIVPSVNLVTNIGFGKTATHTKYANSKFSKPSETITFPLIHPKIVRSDEDTDKIFENKIMLSIQSIGGLMLKNVGL